MALVSCAGAELPLERIKGYDVLKYILRLFLLMRYEYIFVKLSQWCFISFSWFIRQKEVDIIKQKKCLSSLQDV